MAATTQLREQPWQNNPQIDIEHTFVDHNKYLSAVFCKALYDYQSKDTSSLSFRKGDIIEVLNQLDSGWWDGHLNNQRGWFPSNYVTPVSEREIGVAARVEPQDPDGLQHANSGSPGHIGDFWVPQVTTDGRIFYINTQTGERSSELPTEGDYDIEPFLSPKISTTTVSSASLTTSSGTTAVTTQTQPAGFGVQKRSETPEPWIKRLADDGMSYYYINTVDASIRWTTPSPQLESEPLRTNGLEGMQRSDSSASGRPLSVYSDDSDINPLGILGRKAANEHSGSRNAVGPVLKYPPDDAPEVVAAKELQETLQDHFPPIPDSLHDLAETARAAITDLLDAVLGGGDSIFNKNAVKRTVDSIRNLIYASSTLIGPLTSLPPPYGVDTLPPDRAELRHSHRKVIATMVRFITTVRASEWAVTSEVARYENDAAELESAIDAFLSEVIVRRGAQKSSRHVRAVLRSADGHKGVGLNLLGSGAAGTWKGFGFIQPISGERLGPEILTAINQHRANVDDSLLRLESLLNSDQESMITSAGKDVLKHLVSLLGLITDLNVASALDFDSKAMDSTYMKSVSRAQELLRILEAGVEAAFEDGAVFLNAIQSSDRPTRFLVSAIPALRNNVDDVCVNISALIELAQCQADACANAGLIACIGMRDAARYKDTQPEVGQPVGAQSQEIDHSEDSPRQLHGEEEVDMVDIESALVSRTRGERGHDISKDIGRDRSDTNASYESTATGSMESPGSSKNLGNSLSLKNMTITGEDLMANQGAGPASRTPEKGHKLKAVLGQDAPDGYINNVISLSQPWYLRPEHGPKDIWTHPEGGVRGGTLPALIERLTLHDNRDTVFNSTFLVTFKSFTTLDKLFDSLVRRFYLQPPPDLSPGEHKEWSERKLSVIRFRVINVFKQLVTDEDVLQKEDMYILDRIKDFATTVEKEVVPPILAVTQLLRIIERAQAGGDAVKLMPITSGVPPPSIMPKSIKEIKLLDLDPLELARQLTIRESKLFTKIRPMECLTRGRDGKPEDSGDNISALILSSNKVSEWVADAILEKDDAKKRGAVMKQFIAVTDRCRTLQNFSTMAALVAGLNSPAIRRLKKTWEQVGKGSKTQLQDAEQIMDTNRHLTNYRAVLKCVQLPCVPFFGVYLSVLTFIQDGNNDMIQGEIINFSKRDRFAEVVREIKHYQSKPYNLGTIPAVQNFIDESLSALGNTADVGDRMWNLSLEREPRERDDDKMAKLLQDSGFL